MEPKLSQAAMVDMGDGLEDVDVADSTPDYDGPEFTLDELRGMGYPGYVYAPTMLNHGWSEEVLKERYPGSAFWYTMRQLHETMEAHSAATKHMKLWTPEEVDVEDSLEAAFRFDAIVRATGGTLLLGTPAHLWAFKEGRLLGRHTIDAEADPLPWLWGPLTQNLLGHHSHDDYWWHNPTLRTFARRRFLIAGCLPDDPDAMDLYDAILHLESQGAQRVLIKTLISKGMAEVVETAHIKQMVESGLSDPLGMYLLSQEGQSAVYSVQEFIPMQWETRFLVVDGKVVSGAGNVECHTPLDRLHVVGVTNCLLERERNGGELSLQPQVALELQRTAEHIVRTIREASGVNLRDCSLDLCMSQNPETGEFDVPTVVEINALSNSGLYANNPYAVTRAIVARAASGRVDQETNDHLLETHRMIQGERVRVGKFRSTLNTLRSRTSGLHSQDLEIGDEVQ